MFLFKSLGLNISVVIGLLIIYILIFKMINKSITKKQLESGKLILIGYTTLFILFIIFVGTALWVFNFNFQTHLTTLWSNITIQIIDYVGAIIGTVITIFVALIIIKITKKVLIKGNTAKKRVKTILKLVNSLITYTVDIASILIILALWGINVMPALTGLGVVGLIAGLGAQSLIKDLIAGFFIIFEHHFDVEDVVDIDGFKGEVIDIGLKTTKVKNWKGDIRIFANGSISSIINYSLTPSVAIIEFGIGYLEDIDKTVEILNKELPKYRKIFPEILEDPNVLGVTSLADSSVNITVIVKTDTEKHYGIERAIRKGIKEILDEHNIEIPFPQMVIHNPE